MLAARELYTLLKTRLYMQPKWLYMTLILLILLITTAVILLKLPLYPIYFSIIIMIMISFSYEIFSNDNEKGFENAIVRLCTTTFSIIYLGFFATFLSKLTLLPNATIHIATFLLMVFGCDSLAWFFGMLFGKGNRGFIKASPNKSLTGFFGGIFGSIIAALIMYYCNRHAFNTEATTIILVAALIALTSIMGDLLESVLKRACSHKDSDVGGVGIPGRGGFLDSIDSILFSAPIYYILAVYFMM